jgi:malonyl-CoA O-methyltransferase
MLTRVRSWFVQAPRELDARTAYRLWAKNYPPYPHNLLMQAEQAAVVARLPAVDGKRVLDLACGSGRYAQLLCARGGSVVGLDLVFEMLSHASSDFDRVQGNLTDLPLAPESADCIVCGLAVGHTTDLGAALKEMGRVLKPGGAIVYSDFYAVGAAASWKRTFRANSQTFSVGFVARDRDAHKEACGSAGLRIDSIDLVSIPPELAQTDTTAATFRAQWGDIPVAIVVCASKSSE